MMIETEIKNQKNFSHLHCEGIIFDARVHCFALGFGRADIHARLDVSHGHDPFPFRDLDQLVNLFVEDIF